MRTANPRSGQHAPHGHLAGGVLATLTTRRVRALGLFLPRRLLECHKAELSPGALMHGAHLARRPAFPSARMAGLAARLKPGQRAASASWTLLLRCLA